MVRLALTTLNGLAYRHAAAGEVCCGTGAGQLLLFCLFQRPFNIIHTMMCGVTVKISGPIWSALPAAEPFFRCFLQCSQDVLLNLPVPGQDLLWRAIVPTQVNKVVSLGYIQPAFFAWSALSPGRADYVGL